MDPHSRNAHHQRSEKIGSATGSWQIGEKVPRLDCDGLGTDIIDCNETRERKVASPA